MSYLSNPYAPPQQAPSPPEGPVATGPAQPWAVGELVSLGIERFKQNAVVLVVSFVIVTAVEQLVSRAVRMIVEPHRPPARALAELLSTRSWAVMAVSSVVVTIVASYLRVGLIRIWLAAARGQKPSLGTLFGGFDRYLPLLAVTFATTVAEMVGFALLIVPGVIVSLGLLLARYYVVDARMEPFAAMTTSWNATRGQKGHVFLLCLACAGLAILGLLMCGVGVIVTIPLADVVMAAVYTRMSGIGVAPAVPGTVGGPVPMDYPPPPVD